VRNGIKISAARDAEVGSAIMTARARALRTGDGGTADFLERVAASGEPIGHPLDVHNAAYLNKSVKDNLKGIKAVSYEGTVSRGIPPGKKTLPDGSKVSLNEKDVFSSHGKQITSEHRFTIGGDYGHP